MKRTSVLLLQTCLFIILIISPAFGSGIIRINQPGTYSVSASIDINCQPNPTYFTIAGGLSAKNIKVVSISPGRNCMTGAVADTQGFEIEAGAGNDIYSETIFKNGQPQIYYKPLSELVLEAKTYTLYAYGGRDANVVLEMTVTSLTPTTGPGIPTGPGTIPISPTTPSTVPGGPSTIMPSTIDGRWNTDWWGILTITVNGNSVSGNYVESQGRISGTLSSDGRTIDGWWSEAPDYDPPGSAGRFVLTLSPDNQTISGWWCFGHDSGRFNITGTRVK